MGYLIVDLSSNNPTPRFGMMWNAGVDGVWLKATEGASYDASWDVYSEWAPRARAVGLRVGAYHYAQPSGGDAIAEAANFAATLEVTGGIRRRDLRPVLDLEGNPGPLSGRRLVAWARRWNDEVWDRTGTLPLFYSYPYFIQRLIASKPIGAGLWLASYGPNDGDRHSYSVPAPWKKAVCHQYTSVGRITGTVGDVDLNYARRLRPLLAHPIKGLL